MTITYTIAATGITCTTDMGVSLSPSGVVGIRS